MESKHKTYRATTYGNFTLDLPEFNWGVSVSVDVFNFNDTSCYRVFWQTEPNCIVNYEEKLIRNHGFYDLILCWNQEVLSQCPNAKLFPIGAVWTQEHDTSQKKFQVSYLTSDKNICPGHQYRQDIFNCLPISWKEVAEKHGGGQEVKTKFRFLDRLGVTKHKSPPYL